MPASVKTARDEAAWSRAKATIKKEYPEIDEDSDRFWALTQHVYGNMKAVDWNSDAMDLIDQDDDAALHKTLVGRASRPPRLCVVVGKAYVASHRRTLPDGRVITVPAYFTKVVAKPDAPATPRRRKQAEVSHAYAKQDPTKLALRLVAHVEDGTMSHEHAEANLAHLERRAHAGHALHHAGSDSWSPEQTHDFIRTARTALALHARQSAKQKKPRVVVKKPKPAPAPEAKPTSKQDGGTTTPTLSGFPVVGATSRVITASNNVARDLGRKDIETRFVVVEARR
jgi:hypothetical protein